MVNLSTGSRPATAANLRSLRINVPKELTGVSRKELATAARSAGEALDLSPSQRLVLGELVGCYGEQNIEGRLMVWPANAYLARRTGLPERTLRTTLSGLIKLGLIAAHDSANRKRFAIKAADGAVLDAYGFSLTPLYTRRYDFEAGVMSQRRETEAQSRRFDRITIARKQIESVLEELGAHHPDVPALPIATKLAGILVEVPRRGSSAAIGHLVEAIEAVSAEAGTLFLSASSAINPAACPGQDGRHIETTKKLSIDNCNAGDETEPIGPDLVRQACPVVAKDFGWDLGTTGEIVDAGRALRAALGAGPEAWSEAVDKLGLTRAAVLVLYVLQLHEDDVRSGRHAIKNPGGLYRALARKLAAGEADLIKDLRRLKRSRAN